MDDGREGEFGGEIEFRAKFEECIARRFSIPAVTLVIQVGACSRSMHVTNAPHIMHPTQSHTPTLALLPRNTMSHKIELQLLLIMH